MQFSPSSSAQTIRINTHFHEISTPSSPRSPAFPTPPDSPTDSLSSFPSVSSSFFFSSSAPSPHPYSLPQSDHGGPAAEGLIIPSLTLPTALQQPTPYGQTLGDVRLILLGQRQSGKTALANYIVDGNVDVVDIDSWEVVEGGQILRASTDWLEERDQHGLERFEGARNFSILKLPGFDPNASIENIIRSVIQRIHETFYDVRRLLNTSTPTPSLHSLLSSSHTPLHTALIFVASTPPTPKDLTIITALSPHIPVICLPPPSTSTLTFNGPIPISSFRPLSAHALRSGLFRTPQTLATLRSEASDRFLRWREIERAVADVHGRIATHDFIAATVANVILAKDTGPKKGPQWIKAEWESSLSEDVARALRPVGEAPVRGHKRSSTSCHNALLDPLHLPSLSELSASLLMPLRTKVFGNPVSKPSTAGTQHCWGVGGWRLGLALVGVFCAGLGIGIALSA